jgi:hypothetical protein
MMSYDYGGRDERQNSTCILSGMDIALGGVKRKHGMESLLLSRKCSTMPRAAMQQSAYAYHYSPWGRRVPVVISLSSIYRNASYTTSRRGP